MYKLSHELSNDLINLRLIEILPKHQENLESSYHYCVALSPPPEMKIFSALVKISGKTEIEHFPQCAISHKSYSLSQLFYE